MLCRKASVFCSQCQGDSVNWDQWFTISALCEGCDTELTEFSWSLYLVNASSKPRLEGKGKGKMNEAATNQDHNFKAEKLILAILCCSSTLSRSGSQYPIRHRTGSCYILLSSTCCRRFTVQGKRQSTVNEPQEEVSFAIRVSR